MNNRIDNISSFDIASKAKQQIRDEQKRVILASPISSDFTIEQNPAPFEVKVRPIVQTIWSSSTLP